MRILNVGSLNIDFVYSLHHTVAPGETITSNRLDVFAGGKGLNQSIALARAGADVSHAGLIGPDGGMLRDACADAGVDVCFIREDVERTGNAIIQVDETGQNAIILYPGANRRLTQRFADEALAPFAPGDMLLVQNETNLIDYFIEAAHARGMTVALNPSPFDDNVRRCDLGKVDIFLLNEVEGGQITGCAEGRDILEEMRRLYPAARIVLTLGEKGVLYAGGDKTTAVGAHSVPVVDTTAAGDTFTGYFLAAVLENAPVEHALALATKASALAIGVMGASASIPTRRQVELAVFDPA